MTASGSGVAVGLASAEQQDNRSGGGLSLFNVFPKMLIPVLFYTIVAYVVVFTGGGESAFLGTMDEFQAGQCSGMENAQGDGVACRIGALNGTLFSIDLPGGVWTLSTADLILIAGLAFLFLEIIKSAGSSTSTLLNHGLSMALLLACLLLFLLVPVFATSTFFLLTMMVLLDVVAGFTVTAIAARRDLGT